MNQQQIEYIDDKGVIEYVDVRRGEVTVRLQTEEECHSCPASKLCMASGSGDKLVTVAVSSPGEFHKGMTVVLRGSERLHRKAIMLATVFPCIALIAIMVLVYLLTGGNQLAAALSGAGAMVLFYFVLWLMRNKVAHEFTFDVLPR